MNEQLSGVSVVEDNPPSCQHHWVIQDSGGPQSQGVCRICGALKSFKNYMETSYWGDDRNKTESRPALVGRSSQNRLVIDEEDES